MTYYGYPVYPTPLVNPSNIQIINTSTALGQTSYGVTYLVQSGSAVTLTLPVLLTASVTKQITIVNDASTGNVTVNTSGANQIRVLGVATNSFTLTPGDTVVIENNGVSWSIVDNSSWKANLASPSFTGTPTAPTAAITNNSTQLATTAFTQALGLHFPVTAGTGWSTSGVISANSVNTWGQFNASGIILTLPQASSVSAGSTLSFIGGLYGGTLNPGGSDTVINRAGGQVSSLPIAIGEYVTLVANPTTNAWYVFQAGFGASTFSSVLSGQGYQKFPGGLILQWGSGTFSGASDSINSYNYTIAFPTAALQVIGTIGVSLGSSNMGFQTSTASQFSVGYHNSSGTTATSLGFEWMAVGY